MTGILVFGLIAIWGSIALMFSQWLRGALPNRWWKSPACSLISVLFFLLPIGDEIVGGFQFRAICQKDAYFNMNADKIEGKTVRSVVEPSRKEIRSFPTKIFYSHFSYQDQVTGEELANFTRHEATGGWLAQMLAFSSSAQPFTFHSVCDLTPQTNLNVTIIH
jgi:hypothetical protein